MVDLGVTMTEFMFFLLPAAGSMMLVYGIYQAITDSQERDKAKIKARLQERSSGGGSTKRDKQIRESILRRQNQEEENPFYQFISGLKLVPRIQTMLDQANVEWPATKFLVVAVGAAAGAAVAVVVVWQNLLVAAMAGVMVYFLPMLWLKFKRNSRMKKLVNQLPDVFEMMSQALRAGHSLAGSIQAVAEQLPDPAGTEFGRVFHEQNLGLKMEDALLNLANRSDQMDIRFFVTAVLIQRQTGGDLAEVLDKISGVIRGRIELLGTVRALTAEGRLSGCVLLALPILVFFGSYTMNREYTMTLIEDPIGQKALFAAGTMQLLGAAMIKKIVNIKV